MDSKEAKQEAAPIAEVIPEPPKRRTREVIAIELADAHVALDAAKQFVTVRESEIDQLIRELNNTPEEPV